MTVPPAERTWEQEAILWALRLNLFFCGPTLLFALVVVGGDDCGLCGVVGGGSDDGSHVVIVA